MLQPRALDTTLSSRTSISNPLGLVLCCSLLLITPGFSQYLDDVYNVQPTPVVRLNNEADLTTVLLLNNGNNINRAGHGRFLNVKPTVGLLTSTTRTFIQGGVTTEYATQVLGTTLDNGRLYAQLLKKSSRVLYAKDTLTATPKQAALQASTILPVLPINARPNLSLLSNQRKTLQSHNDLIGDQDWQIIDDHLLVNNRQTFVGNTDYISPSYPEKPAHLVFPTSSFDREGSRDRQYVASDVREIPAWQKFIQNISNDSYTVTEQKSSTSSSSSSSSSNDGISNKIEAQKVQGAIDLPTFTVKHMFAPSGYTSNGADEEERPVGRAKFGEVRTPKILYHHARGQQNDQLGQYQAQQQQQQPTYLKTDDMRHLSTVTYYGFADFTTLVGDTVIVFSPSTAAPSPNIRQITTIKGEATLNKQQTINTRTYEFDIVPTTVMKSQIEPTFAVPSAVTVTEPTTQPPEEEEKSSEDLRAKIHYVTGAHHEESDSDYETGQDYDSSTPQPEEEVSNSEEIQPNKPENVPQTIFFNDNVDVIQSMITNVESSQVTIEDKVTTILEDTSSTETERSESISPHTTETPPMLSTPSNEDIAKIFASLASAEAAKKSAAETTTSESVESTVQSNESSESTSVEEEKREQETVIAQEPQVFGGVTTIFFEDDPFQAFETSKTSDEDVQATQVVDKAESEVTISVSTESVSAGVTEKEEGPGTVLTTSSETGVTTEQEPTAEEETTTTQPEVQNELDCKKQSQVLPTLVPKTLTYLTTFFIPDEETTSTSIESNVVVTYDVSYQTQYGCDLEPTQTVDSDRTQIQATSTVEDKTDEASSYILERPTAANAEDVTAINDLGASLVESATASNVEDTTKVDEEEAEENEDVESEDEETDTVISDTPSMIVTEKAHVTEESETVVPGDVNEDEEEGDDQQGGEEIELLYKTLYTTYTYLTTFFHDSTTSVSSRKEVVTNVVTSTLGPSAIQGNTDIAQLLSSMTARSLGVDESRVNDASDAVVMATKLGTGRPTNKYHVAESDLQQIDGILRDEQNQRTESLNDEDILKNGVKTYYTTYTYFTTIFVDGETETTSRTEVYTNYVTGSEGPTVTVSPDGTEFTVSDDDNKVLDIKPTSLYDTIVRQTQITKEGTLKEVAETEKKDQGPLLSGEVTGNSTTSVITMVTDVQSTSSDGDRQIIENHKKQWSGLLEDQISSESNTEDILPSPTLLLQTSYTTFTYFTTMYIGSTSSRILSRLETITNVVTETLQSTQTLAAPDATLPITYFTTFTYWTTLYKDGEVTTLNREETVSNVVHPSATISPLGVDDAKEVEVTSAEPVIIQTTVLGEEVLPTVSVGSEGNEKERSRDEEAKAVAPSSAEPTIYYTTYTYYTTSYVGDETILNSRFETVTNIVTPTVTPSGREINLNPGNTNALPANDKPKSVEQPQPAFVPGGIQSSEPVTPSPPALVQTVEEALRKAEAAQSSRENVESHDSPLEVETPSLENSVLFLNKGKVVDAEGISTIFYTTKGVASIVNGDPTQIIESTSSIHIDEEKKATQTPPADPSQRTYKTGLVRLIEGTIIANKTTTLYESKVIGTIIGGRYAQIIESTSSFLVEKTTPPSIAPTASFKSDISPTTILEANINDAQSLTPAPSSDAVGGSITDGTEEGKSGFTDDDSDDEDGVDENGTVKSRLTFQTKKRTFTPVIRPFASRNRPLFAPKRKNLQPDSATIITRSDFTPTITATPAIKSDSSRGRFSSIRKSNIAVIGSSAGGSRKFSRGRSSATGFSSGSAYPGGASRNRLSSSRIQPTSSYFGGSSRRGGVVGGRSSSLSARSFSSLYNGNSRLRIKPTLSSSFEQESNTNIYTTQNPDADEETGVTQSLDEAFEEEEAEVTTPNPRRSNNPLLRFNRPPIIGGKGVTPRNLQISTRRNPLSQRARTTVATTTTTTTAKPRPKPFLRPLLPSYQNRPRTSNALFQPRGLLRAQANQELEEENKKSEDENSYSDDLETENGDYDDDEDDEDEDGEDEEDGRGDRRRRQSTHNQSSTAKFKALIYGGAAKRRVRRQTDRASNFRSRFRRPSTRPTVAEERSDVNYEEEPPQPVTQRARPAGRFSGRKSSPALSQPTHAQQHTTNNRIRPTKPSLSSRPQFTLREKDTVTKPSSRSSGFRRPTTSGISSRRSTTISRPKAPRLKSYTNSVTEPPHPSRSTSGRSRTSSRGRSTTRSRSRPTEYSNDPVIPSFDGTITVTHHIPTEITIPVVNGKVTEYKNVVTAKMSTEVVPPNLYNTLVGRNGNTVLALVREESTINNNGATEVTQFILHETLTTSIIFTPTTIRGRRTSFSHIIPSTVYDVEQVVSTIQPQIAANAPLANILLSQLLLGNIGLNQQNLNGLIGLGAQPQTPLTPTTEFKTRTTTYVTTVTNAMSTVIPLTFRGKEILTTIVDSSTSVITATEFLTDTIVVTPTMAAAQQVNSLLLPLLLQQQVQQAQNNPLIPIQNTVHPQLSDVNAADLFNNQLDSNADDNNDFIDTNSFGDLQQQDQPNKAQHQPATRKRSRKGNRNQQPIAEPSPPLETSVITLYVSGRRPGEFSTVLSTIIGGQDAGSNLRKRAAEFVKVEPSAAIFDYEDIYNAAGSDIVSDYVWPTSNGLNHLAASQEGSSETESLESILGDVNVWFEKTSKLTGLDNGSSKSTTNPVQIENAATSQQLYAENSKPFLV